MNWLLPKTQWEKTEHLEASEVGARFIYSSACSSLCPSMTLHRQRAARLGHISGPFGIAFPRFLCSRTRAGWGASPDSIPGRWPARFLWDPACCRTSFGGPLWRFSNDVSFHSQWQALFCLFCLRNLHVYLFPFSTYPVLLNWRILFHPLVSSKPNFLPNFRKLELTLHIFFTSFHASDLPSFSFCSLTFCKCP